MTPQTLASLLTVFVIGLFIGTSLGVLIMCLMRMASPDPEPEPEMAKILTSKETWR